MSGRCLKTTGHRNQKWRGIMKSPASTLRFGLIAAATTMLAAGTAAAEELTVNFMPANTNSCSAFPQQTAEAFGIWKALGVKVNLLSSATTVPYVAFLQNGDADITLLDSAQVLQAVDNNLPIKVVYE